MLTVVGLGNPGPAYKMTRHNAGFMLLDGIAEGLLLQGATFYGNTPDSIKLFTSTGQKLRKFSKNFLNIEGEYSGKKFNLVKPVTFMNESGSAVKDLFSKGIVRDFDELLVVVDDVDLQLGKVRLRKKGSASGHNGLRSIISQIGTTEFTRLRIGVGPRPDGSELVDYVLSTFSPDEFEIFSKSLPEAADAVGKWMSGNK